MRMVGTMAAALVLGTLGASFAPGLGGRSVAQPAPAAKSDKAAPPAETAPGKSGRVIEVPPAGTPPGKAAPKRADVKTPVPPAGPVPAMRPTGPEQEYKDCLSIWDKGTHMTRAEWAATCRRIQNRLNTVTNQVPPMPGRRRAR